MSAKLPSPSAGPSEVRAYIKQALISKQETTAEFAEETAQRWRVGRGSELRRAKSSLLETLFGSDVGQCLFQAIREDEIDDWKHSLIGVLITCTRPRLEGVNTRLNTALIMLDLLSVSSLIEGYFVIRWFWNGSESMPFHEGFNPIPARLQLTVQTVPPRITLANGLIRMIYGFQSPRSNESILQILSGLFTVGCTLWSAMMLGKGVAL